MTAAHISSMVTVCRGGEGMVLHISILLQYIAHIQILLQFMKTFMPSD
jgi:hypothetical protein